MTDAEKGKRTAAIIPFLLVWATMMAVLTRPVILNTDGVLRVALCLLIVFAPLIWGVVAIMKED